MDNQIKEARGLLDEGFKNSDILNRNKILSLALDILKSIEANELNQKQTELTRNIRRTYLRQLLQGLSPTPSVGAGFDTFLVMIKFGEAAQMIIPDKLTPQSGGN